jgi:hypothetical protein
MLRRSMASGTSKLSSITGSVCLLRHRGGYDPECGVDLWIGSALVLLRNIPYQRRRLIVAEWFSRI